MNSLSPLAKKITASLLVLGIAAMAGTAFVVIKEHFATRFLRSSPMASSPQAPEGMGMSEPLVALMSELQEKPNDPELLQKIADIFIERQQWEQAGVFLERCLISKPGDTHVRYLLGLVRHKQNRSEEAAKVFEDLLELKEDPEALYNLAIIYKYRLKEPEKAASLLERLLQHKEAESSLLERARKEVATPAPLP